jgi:hypothetical protein
MTDDKKIVSELLHVLFHLRKLELTALKLLNGLQLRTI